MIATKIENKLRNGFYRLFWNGWTLSGDNVWRGPLIQAIEENIIMEDGICYMPDLYQCHFKPGTFSSISVERAFAAKIKVFINEYASEFNYVIKSDRKIEVKESLSVTGFPVFDVSFDKSDALYYYYLTIYDSDNQIIVDAGKKVYFGKKYTLGRSDLTDIQLKHKYVSGIHAEMNISISGQIRFTDMNSANGTKLNGKRLESGQPCLADENFHVRIAEIYDITGESDSDE